MLYPLVGAAATLAAVGGRLLVVSWTAATRYRFGDAFFAALGAAGLLATATFLAAVR